MIEGEPNAEKLTELERGIQLKGSDIAVPGPPHSNANPAATPQACHSPWPHRVDRTQTARGQEASNPAYDRCRWPIHSAAPSGSDWEYPIG